jgi:hypothetical protein
MTQQHFDAEEHLNRAPVVPALTLCRACGYDLVGLSVESLCPECGTPIARSIRSDALINSAPAWLKTLSRGAALAFWATFTQVAIAIVGRLLLSILFFATGGYFISSRVVVAIAHVILSSLVILGLWWLTTPEHNAATDRCRRIALAARITMFSAIGLAFISYSASLNTGSSSLWILSFSLACVYTVAWGLTLLHAHHLFMRMGLHARANNARIIAWGLIITAICLFGSIGVVSLASPSRFQFTAIPVMCGAMLLMAIFIIAGLVTLGQLMSSLGIVATYASRAAARQLNHAPAGLPDASADEDDGG